MINKGMVLHHAFQGNKKIMLTSQSDSAIILSREKKKKLYAVRCKAESNVQHTHMCGIHSHIKVNIKFYELIHKYMSKRGREK